MTPYNNLYDQQNNIYNQYNGFEGAANISTEAGGYDALEQVIAAEGADFSNYSYNAGTQNFNQQPNNDMAETGIYDRQQEQQPYYDEAFAQQDYYGNSIAAGATTGNYYGDIEQLHEYGYNGKNTEGQYNVP